MVERLVTVMGGTVLETESERLFRIAREDGEREGIREGIREGTVGTLVSLVDDGLLDIAEAARRADMTVEQFKKELQLIGQNHSYV